eukprot:scaffold124514_cov45-Phaeocystis_antarctica.AAC.1
MPPHPSIPPAVQAAPALMSRPAFHASSTAPRPTRHCSTEKAFNCRTGLPPPLAFLPPPLAFLALELAVGTEGRGGSWLPAGCGVLVAPCGCC